MFGEVRNTLLELLKLENMSKEDLNITSNQTDVSCSVDFWKEALNFLETQLNSDFEKNFTDFISDKNFNSNEAILFEKMLKDAISIHTVTARLKHFS